MSAGFSVAEFVAAAELAEQLYGDVYLVARHASPELLQLQSEVATMSMSLKLLLAEVKDEDSVLVQSGKEREDTVNSVLASTTGVLKDIDRFSKQFTFMQTKAGVLGKPKAVWDRVKFARDLRKVDALRARLQYQNGIINLLLISAGNSLLQQLETADRKMHEDIDKLAKSLEQLTKQAPDDPDADFRAPLSAKFIAEAEQSGRRWFSYSVEEWLQAGQWWLMSSQGRLTSPGSTDRKIEVQAYANLLKAASIVLDILPRHPSIRLWDPAKEYVQFQLLADMLGRELKEIETAGLLKPALSVVENANLRMWADAIKPVVLRPEGISWETADEETLWIGPGALQASFAGKSEPCLILVLLSKKDITKARIVAHNQRGVELMSLKVSIDLLRERKLRGDPSFGGNSLASISFGYANCHNPFGNRVNSVHLGSVVLSFPSRELLFELSTVLRGIMFCQSVKGIAKDHGTLHSMVLLFAMASGNKVMLQKTYDSCLAFRCLEFCASDSGILLDLTKSMALDILQNSSGDYLSSIPTLFPDVHRTYRKSGKAVLAAMDKELRNPAVEVARCIHYWAYQIMALVVSKDNFPSAFKSLYCLPGSYYEGPSHDPYGYFSTPILEGVAELSAIFGDPKLLKLALKESGLDINRQRQKTRWISARGIPGYLVFCDTFTLLHSAAAFAQEACVQVLLENGADPSVRLEEDDTEVSGGPGETAGKLAGRMGYSAIAGLLAC